MLTTMKRFSSTLVLLFLPILVWAEDKDINVNIKTGNSGGWPAIYWIIGALVVALLIAITVMATRTSSKQA